MQQLQLWTGEGEDMDGGSDPILNVDDLDTSALLDEIQTKILHNVRQQASMKRKSRLETIFKGGKRTFEHEDEYFEELCMGGNFQVKIW